jgi:hypothetical protein
MAVNHPEANYGILKSEGQKRGGITGINISIKVSFWWKMSNMATCITDNDLIRAVSTMGSLL